MMLHSCSQPTTLSFLPEKMSTAYTSTQVKTYSFGVSYTRKEKSKMLSAGLCVVVAVLLVICVTHWIYKWRNPKKSKNGVLPPDSMGLPFIGETLSLIIPSYSLALHPFIKKRIERGREKRGGGGGGGSNGIPKFSRQFRSISPSIALG
ncbi:unnamed protein product [Ilex paraguariensis]|uniref:Uncharacterized protein n=1 Tax=Ilex paraguariensis TaxID=185542 RepID=A0ABC8SNJ8_9AQUA